MMSQSEATQFIAELTRETLAGRLRWQREIAPDSVQVMSNAHVDYIYVTRVDQWIVGVFEGTYKDHFEETNEWYNTLRPIVATFIPGAVKVMEYVLPKVYNAEHLMNAIQSQVADVRGLLDAWKNRPKSD